MRDREKEKSVEIKRKGKTDLIHGVGEEKEETIQENKEEHRFGKG